MSNHQKILILTNSEPGQTNMLLAVTYEFALLGCEIHVASFKELEARVQSLQEFVRKKTGRKDHKIYFHTITGPNATDKRKENSLNTFHSPGIQNMFSAYSKVIETLLPWTVEEYARMYGQCMEIITSLNPDITLIDSLFSPGLDARAKFPGKYFIMNVLSHHNPLISLQPPLKFLFDYPPFYAGIPVPLPWYHKLLLTNLWLILLYFCIIQFSSHVRQLNKFRRRERLTGQVPCFQLFRKKAWYLCPSTPEMEPPYPVFPKSVMLCGPLICPPLNSLEEDARLKAWLQKAPTIMINMGTIAELNRSWVENMVTALSTTLATHKNLQVIWKLNTSEDGNRVAREGLSDFLTDERLLITSWLTVDPGELLSTGHIVCSVHHGGANTFYEAAWAGIPQIVLPTWFDCYDAALRAERLGIGLYANKSTAPGIDGESLARTFSAVISDIGNEGPMVQKSRSLAILCKKAGGRRKAAETMLALFPKA